MDEMKRIEAAAETVIAALGTAEIGVILGSGLGDYAGSMADALCLPYSVIPGFPRSTVPGHAGMLVCGTLHGRRVVMMQGRFHYYEGYTMQDVVLPVRVMKMMGVKTLIVTNACGGVNLSFAPGDLMVISDYLTLTGVNPLMGKNLDEFGPRFPDMTHAYDTALQNMARTAAAGLNMTLREGVYMFFPGPQFETPAEIRAARILGADAAGMSTVPEVITANHCGMKVLGFTLCSNMAAGILDRPLSEQEVLDAAEQAKDRFSALVRVCLANM